MCFRNLYAATRCVRWHQRHSEQRRTMSRTSCAAGIFPGNSSKAILAKYFAAYICTQSGIVQLFVLLGELYIQCLARIFVIFSVKKLRRGKSARTRYQWLSCLMPTSYALTNSWNSAIKNLTGKWRRILGEEIENDTDDPVTSPITAHPASLLNGLWHEILRGAFFGPEKS